MNAVPTPLQFTAHNILLDNGIQTKPDTPFTMDCHPWFVSTRKVLRLVFGNNLNRVSIVDLGCLEGGYAVEFARLGMDSLGIEIRRNNFECCLHVKNHVNLPRLRFVQDDAHNFAKYGKFDVSFCCGLFYHLGHPRDFLQRLAANTRRVIVLQTHFSLGGNRTGQFPLSELTTHEGLKGRWFKEFDEGADGDLRESSRWSSFHNDLSFWILKEHLLAELNNLGFDTVIECFDHYGQNAAEKIEVDYERFLRGTFIGIRS